MRAGYFRERGARAEMAGARIHAYAIFSIPSRAQNLARRSLFFVNKIQIKKISLLLIWAHTNYIILYL